MARNKYKIIVLIIGLLVALLMAYMTLGKQKDTGSKTVVMHPVMGDVMLTVVTTGVVEPQNRLQIKPSIGGRIEKILFREGDRVKTGDILAWMSSTERAA